MTINMISPLDTALTVITATITTVAAFTPSLPSPLALPPITLPLSPNRQHAAIMTAIIATTNLTPLRPSVEPSNPGVTFDLEQLVMRLDMAKVMRGPYRALYQQEQQHCRHRHRRRLATSPPRHLTASPPHRLATSPPHRFTTLPRPV